MKIVIDARLWSQSGIGRYLRNLIGELEKLDRVNKYFILYQQRDYDKILHHKNFHKILADFSWYSFREQINLLKIINNLKPDLVHFPHFNVPILYQGKFVVTIHDLIHQHFQTRQATTHNPIIYFAKKIGYKKTFSHAISHAAKIIVPSNFVKEQLIREWMIKSNKITVTYEAVEEKFIAITKTINNNDFIKLSNKFVFQKPYLFYVGNAQPHKNLAALIRVFRKIREKRSNLFLVLSGPEHFFWEKIKKESHIGNIIFTGFISEKELAILYKNAEAYICPSLEEGFGIPILEAMAAGCPVVSSYAGSLKEIGGNAPLYFDPKNEEDIMKKISKVLNNDELKKDLILKGKKRSQEFNWKKLAEQTLEIYKTAGNNL